MHFLAATALLSLVSQSTARIPHSFRQLTERDPEPEANNNGMLSWLGRMVKSSLHRRQDACYEDQYYEFVNNSTFGETFCQAYMQYPSVTTTVDYTPASTIRTVITTYVITTQGLVRTTPTVTVTTTITPVAGNAKRDPAPSAAAVIEEAFALFNRQANLNGTAANVDAMSSAFSSACACQTYSGSVLTVTYTDEPTIVATIDGFVRTTTTITTTRTAGALTSTVTVTASPVSSPAPTSSSSSGGSSSSSSSAAAVSTSSAEPVIYSYLPSGSTLSPPSVATQSVSSGVFPPIYQPSASGSTVSTSTTSGGAVPTSAPFTCPEDNNSTVSQMIGNERFDYLVLCDFDLPNDPNFFGDLSYKTFGECTAACSLANANFDDALCQAAVYTNTTNSDGYNCFLKSSANSPAAAPGIDVAILQRIAVGLDSSHPNGTNTESIPFSGPTSTIAVSALSAEMMSLMNASSTSVSIITPGPVFKASGRQVDAFTAFSTFVSGGSTYSTGSYFSTYYTSNGSWYFSYYSTYTLAWASASTVVAYGADSTQVSTTNKTTEYVQGGSNGGYVTITNTSVTTYTYYADESVANQTDTLVYSSFAANNSFITASTSVTSNIYTQYYQTEGSGGTITGGGNGGASGAISSNSVTVITSTTEYASSGAIATPAPSYSSTVVIQSFGTGGAISGGGSGALPLSSTASPSGVVPVEVSSTVVVVSFNTGGSTGGFGSGAITVNSTGYGSAFSTAASGSITTPPPLIATAPGQSSSTDTVDINTDSRRGQQTPSSGANSSDISTYGTSYGTSGVTSTAASGALNSTSSTIPNFPSTSGYVPPVTESSSTSDTYTGPPTGSRTGIQFPSSSGVSSYGTGGASSTAASGSITDTSSTIPTLSSTTGYVPPTDVSSSSDTYTGPPTGSRTGIQFPSSSGVSSFGTGGVSSTAASGSIPGTSSTIPTLSSNTGYVPPTDVSSSSDTYTGPPTGSRTGIQFPSSSGVSSFGTGGASSTAASGSLPISTLPSTTGYVPPTSDTTSSSVPVSSSSSSTSIPELPTTYPGYTPKISTTASSSAMESSSSVTPGPSSSGTAVSPITNSASSSVPSSDVSSSVATSSGPSSSVPTSSGVASSTGSMSISESPSSSGSFSAPNQPRSGTASLSGSSDTSPSSSMPTSSGYASSTGSMSIPEYPSSSAPYQQPSSSGSFSAPNQPRSGTASLSGSTDTGPSSSVPSSSGFASSTGSMSISEYPSSSAPYQQPSSSGSFSAPNQPRSGTASPSDSSDIGPSSSVPSSSGISSSFPITSAPPLSTGPITAPPASNTSCVLQGTTTVFTTVTLYGCYSQCLPNQGGYYSPNQGSSGPQAFGPPS